jgi:hypothetical protein
MHGEIVDAMIKYYDDGKFQIQTDPDFVPDTESIKAAEVFLLESGFDYNTEIGNDSFFDILIYKTAPYLLCITNDFIQKHRYRSNEKIELLQSMLDSKLGLFEITGEDEGEGYAYLKDVFSGAEHTIVDIGLSGNTNNDDYYLYTRIISYQGINFGSGLNFIFEKTDAFIKDHIQQHRKKFHPNGEFLRFTQLYNHYSQNPD